jgi:hypothetical protein
MNPAFMDHYMSALFFPHTNMEAFPRGKEKLEAYRAVQRMAAQGAGKSEGA